MNDNWLYIAIVLSDESRAKLEYVFQDIIPDGWKHYCHHLTLAFNDHTEASASVNEYYENRIGEDVVLEECSVGFSERAIAVGVNYNDRIVNKHPHITIATAPGAKPVESNFITKWKEENGDERLVLSGTITRFYKK